MWSFFSRDPAKDFAFEVGEAIAVGGAASSKEVEEEEAAMRRRRSVWTMHRSRRKGTSTSSSTSNSTANNHHHHHQPEEVTVFVYDIKQQQNNSSSATIDQLEIARASVKRLKTLRHPSILTYVDSYESDKVVYLVTEQVEPLYNHLQSLQLHDGQQRDLYVAWGIFQITRALSFLNNDGNLRHNNVNIWSVFVNGAGEWKLGGVEYVSAYQEGASAGGGTATTTTTTSSGGGVGIGGGPDIYDPPEKNDPAKQRLATKCSSDMWGLGCLIWEVFNGPLQQQSSLKMLDKIPKQLGPLYCELVGANPALRPNPADIITRCRKLGGYFKNDLVDTLLFLEEIQIKDKNEKTRFFSNLTPHLDSFPDTVCQHKILPQLITAFEYGDAGSAVLAPMFKLGRLLGEADYQRKIVPCVVKLFGSNDRATRSRLLQQLEHFVGHLHASIVNDQIFTQMAHGFMDTNPTIREQTVKSIVHLAPKLNYNNLNVELLRHFARLQSRTEEPQGGIRTNTTVCLAKIAPHLHPQVRQKVLVAAFVRAMRDPFAPARNAGVLALAATQQYYLLAEVASRILPALCQLAVDPEKMVRESVFRTVKGFLGKLEKVSEDPSLRESMEADVNTATPSLSNAAATWAGWAVTAVTAKFYRSQSDTVKSTTAPYNVGGGGGGNNNRMMLTKPASLEQPSSSSISTTTSSVTSMTSLEHEDGASRGATNATANATTTAAAGGAISTAGTDSVSDYDYDQWGDNDTCWGDIETTGADSSTTQMKTTTTTEGATGELAAAAAAPSDGWDDNEEWGSLEDEQQQQHALPGNNDNDDYNDEDASPSNNNAASSTSWLDDEFEPIDESSMSMAPSSGGGGTTNLASTTTTSKLEDARKKREERKLMRQKEMEARRASRHFGGGGGAPSTAGGGPMKLGAKKM